MTAASPRLGEEKGDQALILVVETNHHLWNKLEAESASKSTCQEDVFGYPEMVSQVVDFCSVYLQLHPDTWLRVIAVNAKKCHLVYETVDLHGHATAGFEVGLQVKDALEALAPEEEPPGKQYSNNPNLRADAMWLALEWTDNPLDSVASTQIVVLHGSGEPEVPPRSYETIVACTKAARDLRIHSFVLDQPSPFFETLAAISGGQYLSTTPVDSKLSYIMYCLCAGLANEFTSAAKRTQREGILTSLRNAVMGRATLSRLSEGYEEEQPASPAASSPSPTKEELSKMHFNDDPVTFSSRALNALGSMFSRWGGEAPARSRQYQRGPAPSSSSSHYAEPAQQALPPPPPAPLGRTKQYSATGAASSTTDSSDLWPKPDPNLFPHLREEAAAAAVPKVALPALPMHRLCPSSKREGAPDTGGMATHRASHRPSPEEEAAAAVDPRGDAALEAAAARCKAMSVVLAGYGGGDADGIEVSEEALGESTAQQRSQSVPRGHVGLEAAGKENRGSLHAGLPREEARTRGAHSKRGAGADATPPRQRAALVPGNRRGPKQVQSTVEIQADGRQQHQPSPQREREGASSHAAAQRAGQAALRRSGVDVDDRHASSLRAEDTARGHFAEGARRDRSSSPSSRRNSHHEEGAGPGALGLGLNPKLLPASLSRSVNHGQTGLIDKSLENLSRWPSTRFADLDIAAEDSARSLERSTGITYHTAQPVLRTETRPSKSQGELLDEHKLDWEDPVTFTNPQYASIGGSRDLYPTEITIPLGPTKLLDPDPEPAPAPAPAPPTRKETRKFNNARAKMLFAQESAKEEGLPARPPSRPKPSGPAAPAGPGGAAASSQAPINPMLSNPSAFMKRQLSGRKRGHGEGNEVFLTQRTNDCNSASTASCTEDEDEVADDACSTRPAPRPAPGEVAAPSAAASVPERPRTAQAPPPQPTAPSKPNSTGRSIINALRSRFSFGAGKAGAGRKEAPAAAPAPAQSMLATSMFVIPFAQSERWKSYSHLSEEPPIPGDPDKASVRGLSGHEDLAELGDLQAGIVGEGQASQQGWNSMGWDGDRDEDSAYSKFLMVATGTNPTTFGH